MIVHRDKNWQNCRRLLLHILTDHEKDECAVQVAESEGTEGISLDARFTIEPR